MTDCRCPTPRESVNPRRQGVCIVCGRKINADWLSTNETVREFYDRLAESTFPRNRITGGLVIPDSYRRFRRQCEARELAGRNKFGLRFLSRDNIDDATEEATDFSNYVLFEVLKARRAGVDPEIDLGLEAAKKMYEGHKTVLDWRQRLWRGMP